MQLLVSEIFSSIQGESSYAGYPTLFIRLAGCNLRCDYCDTPYAYSGGESWSMDSILDKARKAGLSMVTVTGGEPFRQRPAPVLLNTLAKEGFQPTVETNGSFPLPEQRRYVTVMDIKTPGSGEAMTFHGPNVARLQAGDEVKFVITDRRDFEWAVAKTFEYQLREKQIHVFFAPAAERLAAQRLANWLLSEKLHVRLQLQLHKILWPELDQGV